MSKSEENGVTLLEKLGNLHKENTLGWINPLICQIWRREKKAQIYGREIVLITFYAPYWWGRDSYPMIIQIWTHDTQHVTNETTGVISHIHSQPGGGGLCVIQSHAGSALRNRVSIWRLRETGFIVSRGWRTPLVPSGECHWLVWMLPRLSGNWNPLILRDKQNYVWSLDKQGCPARKSHLWEQTKEGTCSDVRHVGIEIHR